MNMAREISEMRIVPIQEAQRSIEFAVGDLTIGIRTNTDQTCSVHGDMGALTFKSFDGIDEKYCLRCFRDLLRRAMAPLGDTSEISPSDSSSRTTLSRYEILKKESVNNEKTT